MSEDRRCNIVISERGKVPRDMQKDSVKSPLETHDHKFRVATV